MAARASASSRVDMTVVENNLHVLLTELPKLMDEEQTKSAVLESMKTEGAGFSPIAIQGEQTSLDIIRSHIETKRAEIDRLLNMSDV